jgi:hypothetical protein
MGYSLSAAPNKITVVIAPRVNRPFLLFFPLWAAVWVTLVLKGVRNGQPQSIFPIILFGLVTVLMAYAWLWNLGGKEELEFTASALTWKRTLFGISHGRLFKELTTLILRTLRAMGSHAHLVALAFRMKADNSGLATT